MIVFRMPRQDRQSCNRAYGRQGFAAKTKCADVKKIVIGNLGRAMAPNCKFQVFPAHPCTVVGHAQERLAAGSSDNLDRTGTGVDRIFNQFLDHAGGPFDHLAGCDLVDHLFAKLPDLHETPFTRFRTASCSYMVRAVFVPILFQAYQIQRKPSDLT